MNKGGRPLKDGLDFMRIDVHMDGDDKIGLIEMDCGAVAFGVVVKLLMQIYSIGYFYPWTEREEKLFCKRRNVESRLCKEVVESALRWKFFDPNLYEKYGVLTSRGIQKRYFFAVKNRSSIETDKKLLLLDPFEYVSMEKIIVNVAETPRGMELIVTESPYITEQHITAQHSTQDSERAPGRAPARWPDGSLELTTWFAFEKAYGGIMPDREKQRTAVDQIIHNARERGDAGIIVPAMMEKLLSLKENDTSSSHFWKSQPFLPSTLVSLWARVWEEAKIDATEENEAEEVEDDIF